MHIFLCCFLYSFLFLSLRQTCSWFRPTSLLDPFFLCVYPSATGRNCLSSVSFAQYGCLCPAALFFSLPHVPILRVYFFCLSSGFFLLPKRWSRFKVVGWLFFFFAPVLFLFGLDLLDLLDFVLLAEREENNPVKVEPSSKAGLCPFFTHSFHTLFFCILFLFYLLLYRVFSLVPARPCLPGTVWWTLLRLVLYYPSDESVNELLALSLSYSSFTGLSFLFCFSFRFYLLFSAWTYIIDAAICT